MNGVTWQPATAPATATATATAAAKATAAAAAVATAARVPSKTPRRHRGVCGLSPPRAACPGRTTSHLPQTPRHSPHYPHYPHQTDGCITANRPIRRAGTRLRSSLVAAAAAEAGAAMAVAAASRSVHRCRRPRPRTEAVRRWTRESVTGVRSPRAAQLRRPLLRASRPRRRAATMLPCSTSTCLVEGGAAQPVTSQQAEWGLQDVKARTATHSHASLAADDKQKGDKVSCTLNARTQSAKAGRGRLGQSRASSLPKGAW